MMCYTSLVNEDLPTSNQFPPEQQSPAGEALKPYVLELESIAEQRAISNLFGEYVIFHDSLAKRGRLTEEAIQDLNFSRDVAEQIDKNVANHAEKVSLELSTENEQREIRMALAFSLFRLTDMEVRGYLQPQQIGDLRPARHIVSELTANLGEEFALGQKLMYGIVNGLPDKDLIEVANDPDYRDLRAFARYFLKQRHRTPE